LKPIEQQKTADCLPSQEIKLQNYRHFIRVGGAIVQLEQPRRYDFDKDGKMAAILGGVLISCLLIAVIILGLCF